MITTARLIEFPDGVDRLAAEGDTHLAKVGKSTFNLAPMGGGLDRHEPASHTNSVVNEGV
ncbi:hypothetical protein [Mycobacterium sp. NPDC050441]|uniref:hypothetical protein n=1 Tax=Mycobacterium sp. NPDC050441 TaxID=3155403 RepID=UPI0033E4DCDA